MAHCTGISICALTRERVETLLWTIHGPMQEGSRTPLGDNLLENISEIVAK